MNKVKYDSFEDVYKRLEKAGIVSSRQIIRRALNGYYSRNKPVVKETDVYVYEGGLEQKGEDKDIKTLAKREEII